MLYLKKQTTGKAGKLKLMANYGIFLLYRIRDCYCRLEEEKHHLPNAINAICR